MQKNSSRGLKGVAALQESRQREAEAIVQFAKLISLDVDLDHARQLELRNKEIRALPLRLHTILRAIRKLDLSFNHITDVSSFSSLPFLSNLNLSKNPELRSLKGLGCKKLVVLSVAHCGLQSLSGLEGSSTTLRTLIANNNDLQLQSLSILEKEANNDFTSSSKNCEDIPAVVMPLAVENYKILASLKALETVVLSRNPRLCSLYSHDSEEPSAQNKAAREGNDVPKGKEKKAEEEEGGSSGHKTHVNFHPLAVFEELTQLAKLSLSECNLSNLPGRWFLPMVSELRLAHNSLTSLQPEGVILRSVKILDISYNRLESIASLRRCPFLQQINIRGNPLVNVYIQRDQEERGENIEKISAEGDNEGGEAEKAKAVPRSLQRSLRRMLKHIQLIDGQPLPPIEELIVKRPQPVKEATEEDKATEKAKEGENPSASDSPLPKKKPRNEGAQKQKVSNVEKIKKELEEKDVVLDIPEVKETHAPLIRREKVHQVRKAGLVESGEAAVAALLKQSNELASW